MHGYWWVPSTRFVFIIRKNKTSGMINNVSLARRWSPINPLTPKIEQSRSWLLRGYRTIEKMACGHHRKHHLSILCCHKMQKWKILLWEKIHRTSCSRLMVLHHISEWWWPGEFIPQNWIQRLQQSRNLIPTAKIKSLSNVPAGRIRVVLV